MNRTTRDVSATILWLELQATNFYDGSFGFNSKVADVQDHGFIHFCTATNEELSARLNKLDDRGRRISYVHHHQEDEVAAELRLLRKEARKWGWTIKQGHKSWRSHKDVAFWILHPTDERDEVEEFFRKTNW